MKHTSGPWVAIHEPTLSRWRIGSGFAAADSIAAIHTGKDARECQHNARLIAAAPDLLAALAKIAIFTRDPTNKDMTFSDAVSAMTEIARDAYTKAITN